MRRREITVTKAVVTEKLHVHFHCLHIFFPFNPFRKESANLIVSVTQGSISSNHAKIMQANANALLVSHTKFDKTSFCAKT
jgi:hypothetical protein